MNTRTLFALLISLMSGAAFAVDEVRFMTLEDAQQASDRTAEEVRAADVNGDRLIDTVEFSALTATPEAGDSIEEPGIPAAE